MAAKYFAIVCAFAVFSAANSQVLNRVIPGLSPSLLPLAENYLPNQVYLNPSLYPTSLLNYDLPCGLDVVASPVPVPYPVPTVVSAPVPSTTIIQDSTVANSLANALQLLVVSNLLGNTLPLGGCPDVVVPSYAAPLGLPGYSYVL